MSQESHKIVTWKTSRATHRSHMKNACRTHCRPLKLHTNWLHSFSLHRRQHFYVTVGAPCRQGWSYSHFPGSSDTWESHEKRIPNSWKSVACTHFIFSFTLSTTSLCRCSSTMLSCLRVWWVGGVRGLPGNDDARTEIPSSADHLTTTPPIPKRKDFGSGTVIQEPRHWTHSLRHTEERFGLQWN
jgi:hypothetical protein